LPFACGFATEGLLVIAGYHLIWTAYGWWLPNDPRGSTSREIRRAELAPLGELHCGRKRLQPAGRLLAAFYDAARGLLKHDREYDGWLPGQVRVVRNAKPQS
jgi:hypothetical protein